MKLTKRERYLVAKLGEEAAELAAACSKLLAKPTEKRVIRAKAEYADVLGVGNLTMPESPYIAGLSKARTRRESRRAPKE